MPKISDIPASLLPFISHGIDFSRESLSGEAIADCPFCDRESKFYVNETTGKWNCFDCGEYGNALTFLRRIFQLGSIPRDASDALVKDRGLLRLSTLSEWGVSIPLSGTHWSIPGFSAISRDIVQLYRYLPDLKTGKRRLIATTGLEHGLFGVNLFDDAKPDVYICEGPWDAMVLYEVLAMTKREADGTLAYTPNYDVSLATSSNVLAVPGCKVFNPSWTSILKGKRVFLLYDNDHPRTVELKNGAQHMIPSDGLEGMKNAACVMSLCEGPPAEVNYLHWGTGDLTYDPSLKHGFDLRDALVAESSPSERVVALRRLLQKVRTVPSAWLQGKTFKNGQVQLDVLECTSWRDLMMSWRRAIKLTPGLQRALACMLSACLSTGHVGDQIWFKIVSCASSGKTMLCEALSVARDYVFPKSTTRGFHSGYKSDKDGTADHSLIPLLRGKTLVTKDGDTLLQSPAKDQILSEGRDLYDRVSRCHYKNGVDRDYEDVSMTWILCGTSSLRTLDSSELGERFLTCSIMDTIDPELERTIARRATNSIRENLGCLINGTPDSRDTPEKIEAKRMTGGYVEYLRKNVQSLYRKVVFWDEAHEKCLDYAEFVAYMRARPSKKQEELAEREFSIRLSNQLTLLAASLAVVTNVWHVDDEIMQHVGKVAMDTARGRTLDLVHHLARMREKGAASGSLAVWTGQDEEKETLLLKFLKRIGVVELFAEEFAPGVRGQPKWRLTKRLQHLYDTCVTPTLTQ